MQEYKQHYISVNISYVEYLTKSWGGRSRSISRKDSEGIMTSPKITRTAESSEHLKER